MYSSIERAIILAKAISLECLLKLVIHEESFIIACSVLVNVAREIGKLIFWQPWLELAAVSRAKMVPMFHDVDLVYLLHLHVALTLQYHVVCLNLYSMAQWVSLIVRAQ